MGGTHSIVPGMVFARDYRVVAPLAEGGMGTVWVAEQLSTGKKRALKVMHPSLVEDARSRERFAQEARVGAQIASEHVVDVVAAGVDDATGIPWLAMELLEGEDLAALMNRRGRLAPDEALALFRQACHALAAAHARGIVHRDLKPENVFVAVSRRQGVDFVVKILDFGIARIVQDSRAGASTTGPLGTPVWMAPEQAQGAGGIGPATDVWALGLVAYFLLTGRYYWWAANGNSSNVAAVLTEVLVQPLEPASSRAARQGCGGVLPPGFDPWFARCVARDPAQRFPDAGAALAALVPALSGVANPTYAPSVPAPAHAPSSTLASGQGVGGTLPVVPPVNVAPPVAPKPRVGVVAAWVVAGSGLVAVATLGGLVWVASRLSPPDPEPPVRVVVTEDAGEVVAKVDVPPTPVTGTLVVQVNVDGAEVYVDGARRERVGRSCVVRALDHDAPHQLVVRAPGYETYSQTVYVAAGEPTNVGVFLTPLAGPSAPVPPPPTPEASANGAPGSLLVTARPRGRCTIGDQTFATGRRVELPSGTHAMVCVPDRGGRAQSHTVSVIAGQLQVYVVDFSR